jgi:hypothetical protein
VRGSTLPLPHAPSSHLRIYEVAVYLGVSECIHTQHSVLKKIKPTKGATGLSHANMLEIYTYVIDFCISKMSSLIYILVEIF